VEEFYNFFPKLLQVCTTYNSYRSKPESNERSHPSISTDIHLKFKHIEKMTKERTVRPERMGEKGFAL